MEESDSIFVTALLQVEQLLPLPTPLHNITDLSRKELAHFAPRRFDKEITKAPLALKTNRFGNLFGFQDWEIFLTSRLSERMRVENTSRLPIGEINSKLGEPDMNKCSNGLQNTIFYAHLFQSKKSNSWAAKTSVQLEHRFFNSSNRVQCAPVAGFCSIGREEPGYPTGYFPFPSSSHPLISSIKPAFSSSSNGPGSNIWPSSYQSTPCVNCLLSTPSKTTSFIQSLSTLSHHSTIQIFDNIQFWIVATKLI